MNHISELNQEFNPGDMVLFAKGERGSESLYIGTVTVVEDNVCMIKSDKGREISRHKKSLFNIQHLKDLYPEKFI